jgi:L-ascorbate metabolism protein UlaG (beta-lactamase superfamily)
MVRAARRAGFPNAEVLRWGDRRTIGPLTIDCVPGERIASLRTNAYLIASAATTVLVATEARHILPDARVDVAVLPIDGARLLGRRLVMDATEAAAARRLGARLLPIHYSQQPVPVLLQCPSGPHELPPDIDVLDPGVRTVLNTVDRSKL